MLRPNEPQADDIFQLAADTGRFFVEEEYLFSMINRQHSPALIAKAVWHGFLPMYEKREQIVLFKLHIQRCLLPPGSVHIGRQIRKKAANFRLSVNEAFPAVVKAIQEHTFTTAPGDCWLADEFAELYTLVNKLPASARRGVSFFSVELWHNESGKLVAGEIGYTVGAVYSSCTGFALKKEFPGVGTLQLAALGKLLEKCGFELWDLGMELDYKKEIGGTMQPRKSWLSHVRRLREVPAILRYEHDPATTTTKELVTATSEREVTDEVGAAATGRKGKLLGVASKWKTRDGLPDVEGADISVITTGRTLDAFRDACQSNPDCVGFAFCPADGKWFPKKTGTGFNPITASYSQKWLPQIWEWHYLGDRAQVRPTNGKLTDISVPT